MASTDLFCRRCFVAAPARISLAGILSAIFLSATGFCPAALFPQNEKVRFVLVPADNSTDRIVALQFDVQPTNPAINFGSVVAISGNTPLVTDGHLVDPASRTHRFVAYNSVLEPLPASNTEFIEVELNIPHTPLLNQPNIEIKNVLIAREDAALTTAAVAARPLVRLDSRTTAWVGRSIPNQIQALDLVEGTVASLNARITSSGTPPQEISLPPTAPQITHAPLAVGLHELELTATNSRGISSSLQRTVRMVNGTSFSTYQAFADAFLGSVANSALRLPGADADGDGFSNAQEFLFGGDPLEPNSVRYEVDRIVSQNQLYLRLRFHRANNFPWTWRVENSRNLAAWLNGSFTSAPVANGFQEVTALLPLTATDPTGFLRVFVEVPQQP